MQEQVNVRPMVDILSEQTGKTVVMDGEKYVYLDTKEQVENSEVETALTKRDEELATATAEAEAKDKKYNGLPYSINGAEHKVSFTSEDAAAMLQVKAAFELGVVDTKIEFSNGSIVPVSNTEFPAFAKWFVEQRNSFFV